MFKITIEETRTVPKDIGHQWLPSRKLDDGGGRTEYDYTPSHVAPKDETVKRYEQSVETLDIAAVVSVVNGLQNAP